MRPHCGVPSEIPRAADVLQRSDRDARPCADAAGAVPAGTLVARPGMRGGGAQIIVDTDILVDTDVFRETDVQHLFMKQ